VVRRIYGNKYTYASSERVNE